MINIIPSPVLFDLGFIKIHYYGIIFAIAAVGFMFVVNKVTKNDKSYNANSIEDLYLYLLIFGLIGARLYDVVFFDWNYYKDNLIDIIKIWQGGIAIQGAVISGAITIFIYCKKNKLSILKYLDIFALAMPLAQSIGRWGNFFNSELYGKVSNLPWAIYISETETYNHPVFLYESILNLILFIVLLKMFKNREFDGKIFSLYLVFYGIIRFLMEFIRIDNTIILANFRFPMIMAFIWVVIGFYSYLYLAYRYRNRKV